jgi:hypothetical protein
MGPSISYVQIRFAGSGGMQAVLRRSSRRCASTGSRYRARLRGWSIFYEDLNTRDDALAVLSSDLDAIDPCWRKVLRID